MDDEIPDYLLNDLPVEDILNSLKFIKNKYGCYEGNINILKIKACLDFRGWTFIINFSTIDSIGMVDFFIPKEFPPVELFAIFYKHWKNARNGKTDDILLPIELLYGKNYLKYQENLEKLRPPIPRLEADRQFFRFCINQLKKQTEYIADDFDIEFSKRENQLRLKAKDIEFYCPVTGNWLDNMLVSSRDFFSWVPKRFVHETVSIMAYPEYIAINSHMISARYIEPENNHNL